MESFRVRGWIRLGWFLGAFCFGGLLFLQNRIQIILTHFDTSFVEPPAEKRRIWNPDLLRVVSGEFLPAVIDWFWMKSLLDPNVAHVEQGIHPQLYFDLKLLVTLDPHFVDAYLHGGNILAVIRDDGVGARELLEQGRAYFRSQDFLSNPILRERYETKQWQLLMVLGYVYLFELDDLPKGARTFKEAAECVDAPLFLQRLAKKLKQEEGDFNVLKGLLEFRIRSEKSIAIRERLLRKKENLEKTYFLYRLNQEFQTFVKQFPQQRESEFLNHKGVLFDPWGGRLFLKNHRIETTTPYQKVYQIGDSNGDADSN